MDDKIIVSNRGALTAKYKAKGLAGIRAALKVLVGADKKRGINTRVLFVDDAATMKKLKAKAVTRVADCGANKGAIDAIFKALSPDYLMILGAPDVVPHQDLRNPAYSPPDDDDRYAWGDLPYACDVPYSRDPARFIGPTRVVGRLPDLFGASEPSYLISLLKIAASYKRRPAEDYARYFGLSAAQWEGSTRMSLDNTFGDEEHLLLSPKAGPTYSKKQLGARTHFINCHGGQASPEFSGQFGDDYPTALTSAATRGKILEGTVASVECCYGGELYDSVTLGIDLPICQSYLKQGCYGYLGSTTIAYGPENDNGGADIICQVFLQQILDGASIGRAALVARQKFVEEAAQMDPFDLKTLAQFCLLGDPSVHPVQSRKVVDTIRGVAADHAARFFRAERRAKLRANGEFLLSSKPTASKRVASPRLSASIQSTLMNIAKRAGLGAKQAYAAFAVKGASAAKARGMKAMAAPTRYLVTIGTPTKAAPGNINRGVAVVAKELAGQIVGYRVYHQR